MSKSRGNVVPPDDQVERWGADTFRAYLMFLGPWDQGGPYDVEGIVGVSRWLRRVWGLVTEPPDYGQPPEPQAPLRDAHRTLARVSHDLQDFHLNTAVAALMELTNALVRAREAGPLDEAAWNESLRLLLLMLAPICPHLAEELWERLGRPYSIHRQPWPEVDTALTRRETIELVVQVDGRLRDRIQAAPTAEEAEVRALVESRTRIAELLDGHEVQRVIYVPGRLINLVLK